MRHTLLPFTLTALIFALDQWTKWLIKTHVSIWETIPVIPGCFNIVHAENPGVAFGFLADSGFAWRGAILIGVSTLVLAYVIFLLWRGRKTSSLPLRLALALILGGAVGNLYDRVVHGTVTDFIEVYLGRHYFPAFNVADSSISVGGALLLLEMLRAKNKTVEANVPEAHLDR